MARHSLVALTLAAIALFGSVGSTAPTADVSPRSLNSRSYHWVDIWASMPQLTEDSNLPPEPFIDSTTTFLNTTIRSTIYLTLPSTRIQLRFSNAFGGSDLPITSATIALSADNLAGIASIQPRTLKKLTFSGSESVIVPNGALVLSDPIDINVESGTNLAVSVYLKDGQKGKAITSHPGSRTNSWLKKGDHVSAANITEGAASLAHWYFVSAVEAWTKEEAGSLAIVGDSITDGRGSTTDKNNRWPDLLLRRLQQRRSTSSIGIINQAAGGNRILADGLGPNALGRLDRDVLSHSGIKYALIFEGVNDIGTAASTTEAQTLVGDRIIWAFKQMSARLHTAGLPAFVATITPFTGTGQSYGTPEREVTRQRVNAFLRGSVKAGIFDAVADFDKILRDPKNETQLRPEYDSGDFLHPNVAGYQAIADNFPVDILEKFKDGL